MNNLKISKLTDDGVLRKLSDQEMENIIGGNNMGEALASMASIIIGEPLSGDSGDNISRRSIINMMSSYSYVANPNQSKSENLNNNPSGRNYAAAATLRP